MPKLSIIMPTYNGARFLAEQIDSILAQDDDDFELLITDDGSTDATREVSDAYAARDARVRVIPSSGNLGQNNRLAQLIGEARGDYLSISDQDDRWAPDRNRRLFAAIDGRSMVMSRSELIDDRGERMGRSLLEALKADITSDLRLRALLRPMFSAHAMLAERRFISASTLWSAAPFDWLMALEALFSGGFGYVDEAVTFHRLHGGNQSNRLDPDGARLTPSYLRWLLLFRRTERLRLWLALDFLGRSGNLDGPVRRMFSALAGRCRTVWFSEWRALRNDGGLGEYLKDTLHAYAAGDTDWSVFSAEIDLLTAQRLSGPMMREVGRRFRM